LILEKLASEAKEGIQKQMCIYKAMKQRTKLYNHFHIKDDI